MNFTNVTTSELVRKIATIQENEVGACMKEWIKREIMNHYGSIESVGLNDLNTVNYLKGHISALRTLERIVTHNPSAPV